jgi:hypothetical protein
MPPPWTLPIIDTATRAANADFICLTSAGDLPCFPRVKIKNRYQQHEVADSVQQGKPMVAQVAGFDAQPKPARLETTGQRPHERWLKLGPTMSL